MDVFCASCLDIGGIRSIFAHKLTTLQILQFMKNEIVWNREARNLNDDFFTPWGLVGMTLDQAWFVY